MLNQPLVSVIVPCYNVEKYIDQCIGSIFGNGYGNIEVICVDDGSTDSTMDKLNAIGNCKVFRNESQNIYGGGCRNIGLDHAKGKYVYFCDSDDYILPGLLPDCVERCEHLGAEICCFKHFRMDAMTGIMDSRQYGLDMSYLHDKTCETYSYKDTDNVFTMVGTEVWDKFYRKEYLDAIDARFQEGLKNSNDNAFHVKTMAHASSVAYIDSPYYVYRTNVETSVQSDFAKGNRLHDTISAMELAWNYAQELGSDEIMRQFKGWVYAHSEFVYGKCALDRKFIESFMDFLNETELMDKKMEHLVRKMEDGKY